MIDRIIVGIFNFFHFYSKTANRWLAERCFETAATHICSHNELMNEIGRYVWSWSRFTVNRVLSQHALVSFRFAPTIFLASFWYKYIRMEPFRIIDIPNIKYIWTHTNESVDVFVVSFHIEHANRQIEETKQSSRSNYAHKQQHWKPGRSEIFIAHLFYYYCYYYLDSQFSQFQKISRLPPS